MAERQLDRQILDQLEFIIVEESLIQGSSDLCDLDTASFLEACFKFFKQTNKRTKWSDRIVDVASRTRSRFRELYERHFPELSLMDDDALTFVVADAFIRYFDITLSEDPERGLERLEQSLVHYSLLQWMSKEIDQVSLNSFLLVLASHLANGKESPICDTQIDLFLSELQVAFRSLYETCYPELAKIDDDGMAMVVEECVNKYLSNELDQRLADSLTLDVNELSPSEALEFERRVVESLRLSGSTSRIAPREYINRAYLQFKQSETLVNTNELKFYEVAGRKLASDVEFRSSIDWPYRLGEVNLLDAICSVASSDFAAQQLLILSILSGRSALDISNLTGLSLEWVSSRLAGLTLKVYEYVADEIIACKQKGSSETVVNSQDETRLVTQSDHRANALRSLMEHEFFLTMIYKLMNYAAIPRDEILQLLRIEYGPDGGIQSISNDCIDRFQVVAQAWEAPHTSKVAQAPEASNTSKVSEASK